MNLKPQINISSSRNASVRLKVGLMLFPENAHSFLKYPLCHEMQYVVKVSNVFPKLLGKRRIGRYIYKTTSLILFL